MVARTVKLKLSIKFVSHTSAGAIGADEIGFRPHEPREHDGRIGRLAVSRNHATDRQRPQQRPCGPEFSGHAAAGLGRGQGSAQLYASAMPIELRRIIDRMRDHIKKAPPRKDRFDLNEAVNEVIVLARGEITKNGVSVDTHLTEGALPVEGDRVQLQQVVLNLILNAVEAMGSVQERPRELLISTGKTQANSILVAVRELWAGHRS